MLLRSNTPYVLERWWWRNTVAQPLSWRLTLCCLSFVTASRGLCACWDAAARCLWLTSPQQRGAVRMNVRSFLYPTPLHCCTEIRFSYRLTRNLGVGRFLCCLRCNISCQLSCCGLKYPKSIAAVVPEKSPCVMSRGTAARGQDLGLSPKNTDLSLGWCFGFWSLYLLGHQLSCKTRVYCSSSFHRAH